MARSLGWSDENLIAAVRDSSSWSGVMRKLGYASPSGSGLGTVQASVARLALSTEHFLGNAWNKGTGQGRAQQSQRDSKQRWYENHRDVYSERNQRRRKEMAAEIRKAKSVPCADCGHPFPYYVMDFDHRDGEEKLFNISAGALQRGRAAVRAEMKKCDVICSNCHRIRTAMRGGWSEDAVEMPQ